MRGAIPPLPQYVFMVWCLVKHRDNFTLPLPLPLPLLASSALLTMLHPLLENVLQTVNHFEIYCLGAPLSQLGKPRNRMGPRSGLYGGCSNGVSPIHFFQAEHRIQFRSCPMQFLSFSNHEKGALR
jgi:hypothetical protein